MVSHLKKSASRSQEGEDSHVVGLFIAVIILEQIDEQIQPALDRHLITINQPSGYCTAAFFKL